MNNDILKKAKSKPWLTFFCDMPLLVNFIKLFCAMCIFLLTKLPLNKFFHICQVLIHRYIKRKFMPKG